VFQQNGARVERCVAVSKENSAISLFNLDIYHHFCVTIVVIGTV
jgi:hypothetical protein